jgi:WD40 repeat protein
VWDLAARPRSPWSYSRPRPAIELDRTALAVQQALRRAGALLQERDFAAAAAELRAARGMPGHERHPELLDGWWQAARGGRRGALLGSWQARILAGHAGRVTAGTISAGGERALTGGDDGKIRLVEPATGHCLSMLTGHTDIVSSVAISSDGRRAVSCAGDPVDPYRASGDDAAVRVWDLETGRCLHTLTGHTSGVLSVALSSDARLALSASNDGTVRLWDLEAGRCLRTLTEDSGVPSIALSADGRLALLGGRFGEVPVFDLDSGRCRRTLDANDIVAGDEPRVGAVGPVALSADGQLALAGGTDGAMQLWELGTGRCLHRLAGHGDFVGITCVALSLDARFALSADRNGGVRLWDLRRGECLRQLEGHKGRVYAVALTADGRRALSVGDDGTVRLWELDWDYEFPAPADWDEGARPHLEAALAMSRATGRTDCSEDEIQRLLGTLEVAGYGWLREEGVRAELKRMASRAGSPPRRRRRD